MFSLRSRLLSLLMLASAAAPLSAAEKIVEATDDERTFSVRSRLKVEGTLLTAGVDGKSTSLKTTVDGKLTYLERRLPPGGRDAEALRSMRNYQLAEAEIAVGEIGRAHV